MDPWLEQFQERRAAREQADRSFTLLGEELTVKSTVAPEVGLRVARFDMQIAQYIQAVQEAEAKGEPRPLAGVTDEEMLELAESVIRDCLDPAAVPVWERLRDPGAKDPLDLVEIYGLARFMVGKVSGLPTERPSVSSAGPQNGRTSSKVKSGSRAATRRR